jgi:hypothetical protein
MKESYGEELATHTGFESCAIVGNNCGEALTEESAGRVLSPESLAIVLSADGVLTLGRQYCVNRYGEVSTDSAGSETPCMYRHIPCGNRETLCSTLVDSIKVRTENSSEVQL